MKRQCNGVLRLVCVGLLLFLFGCGGPRSMWPQQDLPPFETIGAPGGGIVLVASRNSEFKKRLVEKLALDLAAAGVSQKTVGVRGLGQD